MRFTARTITIAIAASAAIGGIALSATAQPAAPASGPISGPAYAGDKLAYPADYREWVYLSSGLDMTYGPAAPPAGQHRFDNVFVDPDAYRAFKATGTWPDKTIMVLEVRKTAEKGSINQAGQYQTDIAATEVHVKDVARFKDTGGWAFFGFENDKPSSKFPARAACYTCHQDHGIVDTTFVQFYPTLLPIAQKAGTVVAEKTDKKP